MRDLGKSFRLASRLKNSILRRERGRQATEWSNALPNWRCVRQGGRESTGWLKLVYAPKERWVRECGRVVTGWLKSRPKERWVREDGRLLTD